MASGITSRFGRYYLWWPPPPPLEPAAGPAIGAVFVLPFVVLETGEAFVVVFGGGGGGVKSKKASIAARATLGLNALANTKENAAASINVLRIFMAFPLGESLPVTGKNAPIDRTASIAKLLTVALQLVLQAEPVPVASCDAD
jgi:hypothetical protein